VAEELRLDERLGELREIQRHESAGEALAERAAPLLKRDERGAPNRRSSSAFAGARFPEQQCGEILHAIPERSLIGADIVREDILPQPPAKALHRRARADQAALDEMRCAPDLEKDREEPPRFLAIEAAPAE
jgi:hypothetical protein